MKDKILKLTESEAILLQLFIGTQSTYDIKAIASRIFDDEVMINGCDIAIKDIYNKVCEL